MVWRMGKGQMKPLIISLAQVMMDPDSDVLWDCEWTKKDFFIVSSQQLQNQDASLGVSRSPPLSLCLGWHHRPFFGQGIHAGL